jgi:hypothetical protein
MIKLDFRKAYKNLYQPSAKSVSLVEVPEFQFAMLSGAIEPESSPGMSPAFKEALNALYGISYTLKFMSKQALENPVDYSVMALEALWWVEDGQFDINKPDNWHWQAMILQPEHITPAMFAEGVARLRKKKPSPCVERLRLETFAEGLCMQIMHIGPYADEPATVAKMDAFALQRGLQKRGRHHEIYLGNPLMADPEKLKTVLRHPVMR